MASTPVAQIGIPQWNSPFVDLTTGNVTYQWQRFLLALWQGSDLAVGAPAQPQVPGASPFNFTAPIAGSMAASKGTVQISRDQGVTFLTVSTTGGLFPLRFADEIRISWTGPNPVITWLPDA